MHALPAESIQTPDGLADPHAVVDITVPSGALSDRRKAGLVEDVTKAVLEATGWGDGAGVRVWTLIHEVPDGNWGAGGQVVRFDQLREAAKAEREQEGSGKEEVPARAAMGYPHERGGCGARHRRALGRGGRRPDAFGREPLSP